MKSLPILYLDDNELDCHFLKQYLQSSTPPYLVPHCLSVVEDYFDFLKAPLFTPQIVILDFSLPHNVEGTDLIAPTLEAFPDAVIFIYTVLDNDPLLIHKARESGAHDFLSKNFSDHQIKSRILDTYYSIRKLQSTTLSLVEQKSLAFSGYTFRQIAKRIPSIIQSGVQSVIVTGETGVGKEVVANLFRQNIPQDIPFQSINCGALSEDLLLSTLFGHTQGAFTGAHQSLTGVMELANGGWLFLDEIASLPMKAQTALLRPLESHVFYRLGDNKERRLNIKILASTNEPLDELVRQGRFRQDLWQRLCECEIMIPPLRDRKEEVEELITYFGQQIVGGPYEVTPEALTFLKNYDWAEGNVRELRNCLRAMTEYHLNKRLTALSIPPRFLKTLTTSMAQTVTSSNKITFELTNTTTYPQLTQELLKKMLDTAYPRLNGGGLRKLSEILGIPKTTLKNKLTQLAPHHPPTGSFLQLQQKN